MAARERYEALEKQILCSRAALASESRGREREEEPCAYRTAFQRDGIGSSIARLFAGLSIKPRCSCRRRGITTAPG